MGALVELTGLGEGEIAQFWADGSNPVRTELQHKEFLAFPKAVIGKKVTEEGEDETKAKRAKAWNAGWLTATDAKARKKCWWSSATG